MCKTVTVHTAWTWSWSEPSASFTLQWREPLVPLCVKLRYIGRAHCFISFFVSATSFASRRRTPESASFFFYRVSIKSSLDYKHLIPENYMEYKYIILPLLQLVSKILQEDGTPPHWGSHVGRFLGATFPNRWIGRGGSTLWPPRSPDITPLTSFYGGMLRTKCFRHQFQILQMWRQE